MSEDRTQEPSKRRREVAREQGQVAHSPELTAASGWLVALAMLGLHGEALAQTLVQQVRSSLTDPRAMVSDPATLVEHLRGIAISLATPFGLLLASFAAGALAAHQLQVRGLWATGLLAPDPSRLWSPGRGGGLAAGLERTLWAVVKAVLMVAVIVWAVRAEWVLIERLSVLEFPNMAAAAGDSLIQPVRILAIVMVLLGQVDYILRHARFEASMRTTAEEHREDQRMMEGDVAVRAKRRRLARAWRGDAPELLAGASMILTGSNGLTLVLAGGPPPAKIFVRTAAQGNTGQRLRAAPAAASLPRIDAPELALRMAQRLSSGTPLPAPVPAELIAEIASLWPSR
jgi:flagellar biosynthetic protein FlhB